MTDLIIFNDESSSNILNKDTIKSLKNKRISFNLSPTKKHHFKNSFSKNKDYYDNFYKSIQLETITSVSKIQTSKKQHQLSTKSAINNFANVKKIDYLKNKLNMKLSTLNLENKFISTELKKNNNKSNKNLSPLLSNNSKYSIKSFKTNYLKNLNKDNQSSSMISLFKSSKKLSQPNIEKMIKNRKSNINKGNSFLLENFDSGQSNTHNNNNKLNNNNNNNNNNNKINNNDINNNNNSIINIKLNNNIEIISNNNKDEKNEYEYKKVNSIRDSINKENNMNKHINKEILKTEYHHSLNKNLFKHFKNELYNDNINKKKLKMTNNNIYIHNLLNKKDINYNNNFISIKDNNTFVNEKHDHKNDNKIENKKINKNKCFSFIKCCNPIS